MKDKENFTSCLLCDREGYLCSSHIYPKFVVNWIKETSPTGYLRNPTNINKRNQDGPKQYWFCESCEQVLSTDEKKFSEKVFVPYVRALEENHYSGLYEDIIIGDFILRFAIGLQLRSILANTKIEHLSEKNQKLIIIFKEQWKNFLLKNSTVTGDCETHMFFFTSMEGVEGDISKFAPNVNVYLTRAMDNTIIDSESGKILGIYCKIGPIGFITTIKPRSLTGLENTKLHLNKNKLTCAQRYRNPTIVNFLWVGRPKQILDESQSLSEKQKQKINNSYEKDLITAKNSLGHRMNLLDGKMKQKIEPKN